MPIAKASLVAIFKEQEADNGAQTDDDTFMQNNSGNFLNLPRLCVL